jgi:toxin ParE1/3/4
MLASMPGMGARYEPDEPLYAEIRYCPITRHRNHLVFYRPIPDGIEVLRVLHGAREIPNILLEELRGASNADDEADDSGA